MNTPIHPAVLRLRQRSRPADPVTALLEKHPKIAKALALAPKPVAAPQRGVVHLPPTPTSVARDTSSPRHPTVRSMSTERRALERAPRVLPRSVASERARKPKGVHHDDRRPAPVAFIATNTGAINAPHRAQPPRFDPLGGDVKDPRVPPRNMADMQHQTTRINAPRIGEVHPKHVAQAAPGLRSLPARAASRR